MMSFIFFLAEQTTRHQVSKHAEAQTEHAETQTEHAGAQTEHAEAQDECN